MEKQIDIISYKDLVVWQKAMDLVVEIYKLTDKFPKHEQYGLTSQMRRATVSIPSNIAEGYRRGTRKDYRKFVLISFGSGAELETQLNLSQRLKYCNEKDLIAINDLLDSIMRMLNKLVRSLKVSTTPNTQHTTL